MNTNTHPVAASTSSSRDNPCFGTDPNVAALNLITDAGHSYLLPYAQFLYSELTPNPALEREADAPPEKLYLIFASAEVVVVGSRLKFLERAIQKYELKFVKPVDRRYAEVSKTHVAKVAVSFTRHDK